MKRIIDALERKKDLPDGELLALIGMAEESAEDAGSEAADDVGREAAVDVGREVSVDAGRAAGAADADRKTAVDIGREISVNVDREAGALVTGGQPVFGIEACLSHRSAADRYLSERADAVRRAHYGTEVYVRGLIEFTNYCRNNCYYCGIRRGNASLTRYRLTKDEILSCTAEGYGLGFRTFVLQGGEDPYFTDAIICDLVASIKEQHPDCAVTLSIGEKPWASYQAYHDAGADRYLLRHETADEAHYGRLHPSEMSLANRMRCLYDLKEIGYQVGSGIMVGSPGQSAKTILSDLRFLQRLDPDMIGIGPYLVHGDTPFSNEKNGSLALTLRLLSILRLMFPHALLPATTALGTIHPLGREMGLRCGANVLMPNLSPTGVRKLYSLYENKICTGDESAQCRNCLETRVSSAGYQIVTARGDVKRS